VSAHAPAPLAGDDFNDRDVPGAFTSEEMRTPDAGDYESSFSVGPAHHANNYMPLVYGQIGKDRATMFEFTRVVELEATSAERSVLDALEHALAHRQLTRDLIPDHHIGRPVDLSFASEQWQRLARPHKHPGRLDRRHFEACVFTYLAAQLRTADLAIKGSEAYANWAAKLLSWEQCEPLLGEFCAESGLPATAEGFVESIRSRRRPAQPGQESRHWPTGQDPTRPAIRMALERTRTRRVTVASPWFLRPRSARAYGPRSLFAE
jgi:hypothetical protein